MAILRTIETDNFILHQHDDKLDHYSAECKSCGTSSWITAKRVESESGEILLNMSILCPSCRMRGITSVLSDTNPADMEVM